MNQHSVRPDIFITNGGNMKVFRIGFSAVFILTIFSIASFSAQPMTAHRVLDNMRAAYEKSIENVNDYTMVTDMFTTYHKKVMVDGRPVFKTRTELKGMEGIPGMGKTAVVGQNDMFGDKMYEQLRKDASYEGTGRVNGASTHILFLSELKPPQDEGDDHPPMKNVRMYIDTDIWVLRQMTFDMEMEQEGKTQQVQPVISFDDYRNVQGLMIPYTTKMIMEGMDESVSAEDREKARQGMQELEQQMAQMPEQQRKMMEGMLKPQLERLQKMLAGDKMEMTFEVQEVKVNTGLSNDLFE